MFDVIIGNVNADLYLWILLLLVSIMVIIFINICGRTGTDSGNVDIYKIIESAGYLYDPKQDIFYSKMDAWQRNMGYCRLYDEALAPLGMILDCEPIYFNYAGKSWLIEFWKGQYDLTTGCEIGVYTTEGPDIHIPDVFNDTFYNCASDDDCLQMSYVLKKNGKILFTRDGKHWWLTGFILGEFSDPAELTIELSITLKDEKMAHAFVEGLKNAGYLKKEIIIINGKTVNLKYDKPRMPQPVSRTTATDNLIQMKNKFLCDKYQEITAPYDNFPDKIKAIQEQYPDLFEYIIKIGKSRKIFKVHKKNFGRE